MVETSYTTMAVFMLYIVGVFVLAGLSHQLLSKKSFLSEYFLGSRGLGTWTLAFTTGKIHSVQSHLTYIKCIRSFNPYDYACISFSCMTNATGSV